VELFRINNAQTLHGHKLSSSDEHQFFTCLLSSKEFNPRHHKLTNSILHMSKNMQIAIQKFPFKYQAML